MVDTRLPYCDTPDIRRVSNGHCINKDEVWIPILQKAMAKIAGCYEKLHASGTLANALVDLTGGSVATYDLRTPQMAELVQSNELWNFVRSWFVSGCVLVSRRTRTTPPTACSRTVRTASWTLSRS